MPIITGTFQRSLQPGVNMWFGADYDKYEKQFAEIFDLHTSEKNFEEDVNSYGLGLATVKHQGGAVSYGDMAQGPSYNYVHVTYALGFIITREAIEDNKYMELAAARSRHLAFGMHQTKEIVGANILNRGFDSNYTYVDGIELFSQVNLLSKGGTYRNELETPSDLSEAALEQMIIDISAHVDDAGLRISVLPEKLILPRNLRFEAARILGSTLQNDTANNALNVLKSQSVLPKGYCVNQYLTDQKAWFIKTNCPEGMKMMQRRALEVAPDTDFDTENVKFKSSERYSFGVTDKRSIFGSAGT